MGENIEQNKNKPCELAMPSSNIDWYTVCEPQSPWLLSQSATIAVGYYRCPILIQQYIEWAVSCQKQTLIVINNHGFLDFENAAKYGI